MSGIVLSRPPGVDEELDFNPATFGLVNQLQFLEDHCAKNTTLDFSDAVEAPLQAAASGGQDVNAVILSEGQVTKIDLGQNKVTFKYGPIKNLDTDGHDQGARCRRPGNAESGEGWRQGEVRGG